MQPKGNRVVVRKLELADEVTTPAGIVLKENALEQLGAQPIGVVVAVGPDIHYRTDCLVCGARADQSCFAWDTSDGEAGRCPERHRRVEVGEIVLYQRHGGTEVSIEGIHLLVFHESEILAGLDELEAHTSLVDLVGVTGGV